MKEGCSKDRGLKKVTGKGLVGGIKRREECERGGPYNMRGSPR